MLITTPDSGTITFSVGLQLLGGKGAFHAENTSESELTFTADWRKLWWEEIIKF